VRDQMANLDAIRAKTNVSLNWEVRKKEKEEMEQKRLLIENKRREAKDEKPFKTIEALKEAAEEETKAAKADKDHLDIDYELKETGHILADFISITTPQTKVVSHR
ncbi:MAG: carboxy terminal-processing peptidase, partial [Pseudomonadales bacterium]|nr:carboxy terminal-processing peptidase [Pseudomonadales bacterium]